MIIVNFLVLLHYSLYQLHVSEPHSSVSLFSGWDTSEFDSISHIPIKTSNDFYTLGDIIANEQNLHGEHVNIQAVVRSVSLFVYFLPWVDYSISFGLSR